jgi:hypothetical protein
MQESIYSEFGGCVVASRPWAFLQHRVVSAQVETARRQAQSASERATLSGGLGTKLTGDLVRLDRMAAVWPNTIAVVFQGDARPELRYPGEVVTPRILPGRDPTFVLPVATGLVTVDVEIANAVTFDGQRIEQVVIRVSMHLAPTDRYRAVAALAAEHRTELADALLRQVRLEVGAEVEAAIRLNRLSELRRRGLQEVLADRWLPTDFAGKALLRDSFEVRSVTWPDPMAQAAGPNLRLSVDDQLHRVWKRVVGSEVRGIAGAQVGGSSTVIVVPLSAPSQFETERLREEYAKHFVDPGVAVLMIVADNYEDLVREWFRRVDSSPARLLSVEPSGDHRTLLVRINQGAGSQHGRTADTGGPVGTDSARAALTHLLRDQQIEFVGVA